MNPITSRSSRAIPAMGRRLLAPLGRARPQCVAVHRAVRERSDEPTPEGLPGRRSLHSVAAASGTQRCGRRSLHTTASNLGIDPTSRGPRGVLPEFSLKDKVIIVSGGAQGLGLVQTEGLLEAGALGNYPNFTHTHPSIRPLSSSHHP